METKFGIQLLQGRCYLCTKPECSRTANNMRQSLPAFVEFINFSVTSQFHLKYDVTVAILHVCVEKDSILHSVQTCTLQCTKLPSFFQWHWNKQLKFIKQ